MKSLSFFALGALVILTLTSAVPRSVKAPEFKSGQISFRIAAVHLSDTATRIDADIYSRPRYRVTVDTNIYLKSRITDNEYKVQRIEGMPLKEHVYGGDSAHIRATFIFDRLAPSDTVFDFIERGGSWNVSGIDLNYKPSGIKTHLSGTINGHPTESWMLLIPYSKDSRVNKTIVIPVENGKFEYDLYTNDTVPYELISGMQMLSGSWHRNIFFSEGDTISIDLSDGDEYMWNNTDGGYNRKFLTFFKNQQMKMNELQKERHRLDSLEQYYSPEMYKILSQIKPDIAPELRDSLFKCHQELKEQGKDLSPEGKTFRAHADSLWRVLNNERIAFIENDGSLTGLALIYNDMVFDSQLFEQELDIFKRVYADRYSGHPLSTEIQLHLSDEKAEVGKHFPDFTAPDLRGNMHTLSDLIKDKYAVIDLWASWCGPCRKHSMDLIPVYEKWKDKGFTIVGVARENGNTQAMEYCIKTDGYPWLNLVELNDEANIWNKYNVANAGGTVVMVAPSGVIIALDPDASFVDRGEKGIEVHHDLFQLPKSAQGNGVSKSVLGMFYEEYKRMGVSEISVDANIDVGGYTWARYGFNATDKNEALEAVWKTPEAQQFIEDYYNKNGLSEDKPFPMYLLTEQSWGKRALLGSFWSGTLSLKDPTQVARFEKYLGLR